ncbi:MAG TPA: hypothetical protein VGF74_09575, partial [Thermoleophilaceae bacterium]
ELQSLLSDSEAWGAAAEAVRSYARQAFAWDQAAQRHELLYEELLASNGREVAGEPVALTAAGEQPTAAELP